MRFALITLGKTSTRTQGQAGLYIYMFRRRGPKMVRLTEHKLRPQTPNHNRNNAHNKAQISATHSKSRPQKRVNHAAQFWRLMSGRHRFLAFFVCACDCGHHAAKRTDPAYPPENVLQVGWLSPKTRIPSTKPNSERPNEACGRPVQLMDALNPKPAKIAGAARFRV